jgi:O-antigen/teichoic acid export membrane protein
VTSLTRILSPGRHSGLRTRFIGGAFWSVVAAMSIRCANILGGIVVGRLLGRVGLGEYGIILSTLAVITSLAGASLGQFGTRYGAEFKVRNPARAGRIIGLTILIAGVVAVTASGVIFGSAGALAARYMNAPHMVPLVQLSSNVLLFSIMAATVTACLAGLEAFRATAQVNGIAALIFAPVILALTHLAGLRGAIIALAVQNATMFAAGSVALWRRCRSVKIAINLKHLGEEIANFRDFALPAAMSAIAVTPVVWYGNVILVNGAAGYTEMGLFSAALQWYNAVIFIPAALSPVMLSLMASSTGESGGATYGKILRLSFLANGAIAGCAAFALFVLAPWLMGLYGGEFYEAVGILRILAVAAVMNALAGVVGQVIASRASMWWGFTLNLLWGAVFLGVAELLTSSRGAMGLALAYAASYAVHLASSSVYAGFSQRLRAVEPVRLDVA